MNIIISAAHFDWQNMEDCLHITTDVLNLDGVEFSLSESFVNQHCTPATVDLFREKKEQHSFALNAHIWENLAELGPGQGDELLLHWLKTCVETGIDGLVIHGGSYGDQNEGITRTRRVLTKVIAQFERAGIILNLENHYSYAYRECQELFSEPWEFKKVFSIDSPSLRFCFDTGHAHMTQNWEALLRELAPWLSYVHLADNQGKNDDHSMFRQGTVPWDGMFDTLSEIAFNGTFCVEFPVRDDCEPFIACVNEIRGRWQERAGGPG